MPAFEKYDLAVTGTTGNNTHDAMFVNNGWDDAIIQFIVEAAGGGATITWKVQGSIDNSKWYDLLYVTDSSSSASTSTRSASATGTQVQFGLRPYKYFRLVTTLNTNVTYRGELYLV